MGVNINDIIISILAFADDIVIIAQNEKELEDILHCVEKWCKKWRLKINVDKTNVVHFRGKSTKPTDYNFLFDNNVLIKVDKYKYLGIILQEHLDFNVTSSVLASAAGSALGAIISKFKSFKNAWFNTFSKMYNSHVIPIMDYSSGIWRYSKSEDGDNIQNRATRYYLGVHQKAPVFAIRGDIGWTRTKVRHQVAMLRLQNKLSQMSEDNLTKRFLIWYYNVCKNLSHEIKEIFDSINMPQVYITKWISMVTVTNNKTQT